MQSDDNAQPSYFGFMETREDAVILIQSCLRGSLRSVHRRPTSTERPSIVRSGHVFIYEETVSGSQRWTDGRQWSPSRIFGDFLVYGERSASSNRLYVADIDNQPLLEEGNSADWHRRPHRPLANSSQVQPDSLVKKPTKVKASDNFGAIWHMVSYYRPFNVFQGRLGTPSMNQDFVPHPWHLPSNSIPYGTLGTSSASHQPGESGTSPTMCLEGISRSIEHHVQSSWPMLEGTGYYQDIARQDLVPDFVGADSGSLFWLPDGQLDPSRFGYAVCIPDNGPIW